MSKRNYGYFITHSNFKSILTNMHISIITSTLNIFVLMRTFDTLHRLAC
jgi:hypothetical protein